MMKSNLLWKLTVSALLFFSQGVSAALVASYTFSGDASDSSGNGNHGTAFGATLTADRFGNPNSAYHFDGLDDRVVLPVIYSGDQPPMTIAAWIQLDPGATFTQSIFGEYTNSGWTRNFLRIANTAALQFDQYPPSGGGTGIGADLIGDGGWQHIALVRTTDTTTWYLNGALLGSNTYTEPYTGAAPELAAIGSRPILGSWNYTNQQGSGLYSYAGNIDDVMLYDHALSGEEIAALSAVPLPAALWLFSAGIGGLLGLNRIRDTLFSR